MEELILYLYDNINYWWVFFLMTIESTVIPFPSEVVVAPAAYKAAQGEMNIWLVIFFATLGADLGAAINYWGAYYIGRPLVYSFARSKWGRLCMLDESKVEKAENYFERRGVAATLIGRLLPVIRQLISVPAGLAKMNFWQFLLYTTIGACAWNVILAIGGYYLGTIYGIQEFKIHLAEYSHYLNIGIVSVVAVAAVYLIVKKKLNDKKAKQA